MKWLQPIQQFDLVLFQWCMSLRQRETLTALSRAVSKTADGWMYLLFGMVYGPLDWPHSGAYIRAFCLAFVSERLVYLVLKNSCRRNRPANAIDDFSSFIIPSDQFSFPSGHTSGAFLFAVLAGSQLPVLLPFLVGWAMLVGLSRVFLGVHFPTDTLIGALLGCSVGFIALSRMMPL